MAHNCSCPNAFQAGMASAIVGWHFPFRQSLLSLDHPQLSIRWSTVIMPNHDLKKSTKYSYIYRYLITRQFSLITTQTRSSTSRGCVCVLLSTSSSFSTRKSINLNDTVAFIVTYNFHYWDGSLNKSTLTNKYSFNLRKHWLPLNWT